MNNIILFRFFRKYIPVFKNLANEKEKTFMDLKTWEGSKSKFCDKKMLTIFGGVYHVLLSYDLSSSHNHSLLWK